MKLAVCRCSAGRVLGRRFYSGENGDELARLMVRHDVGVRVRDPHRPPILIKGTDEDFFDQARVGAGWDRESRTSRRAVPVSRPGRRHDESDVDLVLIVHDSASDMKKALRRIGHELAAPLVVMPSIMAYTVSEWNQLERYRSAYHAAVEREGVAVL